jgi:hypothetical protein
MVIELYAILSDKRNIDLWKAFLLPGETLYTKCLIESNIRKNILSDREISMVPVSRGLGGVVRICSVGVTKTVVK